MLGRCVAFAMAVCVILGQATALAESSDDDTIARLELRIEAVSNEPGARATAADALEQARLALRRARALLADGRNEASQRAVLIGLAAVTLASRQSARQRELSELRYSARRAATSEVEAALARDALRAALERRRRSGEEAR